MEMRAGASGSRAKAAALGTGKSSKSHPWKSGAGSSPKSRGSSAHTKSLNYGYLTTRRPLPRGVRYLHYSAKKSPNKHNIRGRFYKFVKVVDSGNFMTRSTWTRARNTRGYVKVLKIRKHRLVRQTHWRRSGNKIIPK